MTRSLCTTTAVLLLYFRQLPPHFTYPKDDMLPARRSLRPVLGFSVAAPAGADTVRTCRDNAYHSRRPTASKSRPSATTSRPPRSRPPKSRTHPWPSTPKFNPKLRRFLLLYIYLLIIAYWLSQIPNGLWPFLYGQICSDISVTPETRGQRASPGVVAFREMHN